MSAKHYCERQMLKPCSIYCANLCGGKRALMCCLACRNVGVCGFVVEEDGCYFRAKIFTVQNLFASRLFVL